MFVENALVFIDPKLDGGPGLPWPSLSDPPDRSIVILISFFIIAHPKLYGCGLSPLVVA